MIDKSTLTGIYNMNQVIKSVADQFATVQLGDIGFIFPLTDERSVHRRCMITHTFPLEIFNSTLVDVANLNLATKSKCDIIDISNQSVIAMKNETKDITIPVAIHHTISEDKIAMARGFIEEIESAPPYQYTLSEELVADIKLYRTPLVTFDGLDNTMNMILSKELFPALTKAESHTLYATPLDHGLFNVLLCSKTKYWSIYTEVKVIPF